MTLYSSTAVLLRSKLFWDISKRKFWVNLQYECHTIAALSPTASLDPPAKREVEALVHQLVKPQGQQVPTICSARSLLMRQAQGLRPPPQTCPPKCTGVVDAVANTGLSGRLSAQNRGYRWGYKVSLKIEKSIICMTFQASFNRPQPTNHEGSATRRALFLHHHAMVGSVNWRRPSRLSQRAMRL